jgi:hypothetical protein
MTRVGIVGNGADKFTDYSAAKAKALIIDLLNPGDVVVSGHSPVGGIDIWAEEIGRELGCVLDIKAPRDLSWSGRYGYRARNLDIARSSDVVHVIVVDDYPPNYQSRRFSDCYHCLRTDHIKSGACWTAKQALLIGRRAQWHIIEQEPS